MIIKKRIEVQTQPIDFVEILFSLLSRKKKKQV